MRGRLILGLILGVLVVAALSVYADFTKMVNVLRNFEWWLLPLILLFTLFNYALRFYKWDVYLRLIGATGVSKRDSLMIFHRHGDGDDPRQGGRGAQVVSAQ